MKRVLVLILAIILAVGCGRGHVQLGGTVTYEDGTPLTFGSVIFSTETFMSSGNINPQGKYVMGSYHERDGLPKGTYAVHISGAVEEITIRGELSSYSLIDPKFASSGTSPLTCEIPAPRNTFDIVVPRNPKPKP